VIATISYCRSESQIKRLFSYMVKGLEHGGSKVIGGNMGDGRVSHIAFHMIGNHQIVGHTSLSFHDTDRLNDQVLRIVAEDFLVRYFGYCRKPDIKERILQSIQRNTPLINLTQSEMVASYERLNEHSYLVTRHYDTEHRHIHLAFDCQNIVDNFVAVLKPLKFNRRLSEFILRQIESEYDLCYVTPSWIVRRENGIKGAPLFPYYAKKLGYQGLKKVKAILLEAVDWSSDWMEMRSYCRSRGIIIEKEGGKLAYQYQGVYLKPLQLGYAYTIEGIERRFCEKRSREKEAGRASATAYQAVHER